MSPRRNGRSGCPEMLGETRPRDPYSEGARKPGGNSTLDRSAAVLGGSRGGETPPPARARRPRDCRQDAGATIVEPMSETYLEFSAPPDVHGYLLRPPNANGDGLVLSHGAGSNAQAPLLVALANEFASTGFVVLRCDLPYRQTRP